MQLQMGLEALTVYGGFILSAEYTNADALLQANTKEKQYSITLCFVRESNQPTEIHHHMKL
jgi:hypothetical protein